MKITNNNIPKNVFSCSERNNVCKYVYGRHGTAQVLLVREHEQCRPAKLICYMRFLKPSYNISNTFRRPQVNGVQRSTATG